MQLKLFKFCNAGGWPAALLLFCFFLIATPVFGVSSLLSPQLDHLRISGFRALYNMEYETAKNSFQEMISLDPKDPAGYIYLASTVWLEHLASLRRLQTQLYNRNNAFFKVSNDRVDPKLDKQFYELMAKGKARAEARLRENKNDVSGLYYLGIAHGAIAGYETTVKRSFFSSMKNGTRAVDLHKKLLKVEPSFVDAYVSVGMYNYVLGTLPVGVKILMMLGGVHGSKTEGLKQLQQVWANGRYAREEAGVILVMLYDREKQWESSLKILDELIKQYPSNPVFRLESAGMLARTGRYEFSFRAYENLLKDDRASQYIPDLIHYFYAEALFSIRSWQKAYEHFLMARRVTDKTPAGMITLTHLRAGQCLNAMGKNDEARVEYQFVLKQPNVLDSRDLAQKYSQHPYTPSSK